MPSTTLCREVSLSQANATDSLRVAVCAGVTELHPLKAGGPSISMWERAVAVEACSAGEHTGETRHQSFHARKAALQQLEAPLHMGRKTLLSKLHMLPSCK